MGPRRIAFAIGEPLLLTLDESMLLAFDATDGSAKWQLRFERSLAGVVYTSVGALPPAAGASPWRSRASTSSIAIVVDETGAVHVVDAATGTLLGALETAGPPVALASAADAVALATANEVFLYREGARTALPFRSTALAFARDGAKLALGARSEVVLVEVSSASVIKKVRVRGPVTDLAARPGSGWLVGTVRGVHTLATTDGAKSLGSIVDVTVASLALDRGGGAVAILRDSGAVLTFDWPADAPQRRILAEEDRAIEDVAFAEAGVLGVALDGGDACIVNLPTSSVKRMEPHAGRMRRSGAVRVEEVHPEPPAPSPPPRSSTGSRLGGGALAMIILFVVRLLILSSRSHQPTLPPPAAFDSLQHCDKDCERRRLVALETTCANMEDAPCKALAADALRLFDAHRCRGAEDALQAIDGGAPGVASARLIAQIGLPTTCIEDLVEAPKQP